MAKKLPKSDGEEQEKEYFAKLSIFKRLIEAVSSNMNQWVILEELMSLRADFAIHHAIRGFGMDYEKALELVRNYEGELSGEDREKRSILMAAIDNIVDFAVGAEYRMANELEGFDTDDFDEEHYEALIDVCYKYNHTYANVENQDIEYAMIVAAGLVNVLPSTVLMFMTQGDERVRPWHLQYEGFTAPKSQFPDWLVPPIEHRCRCYLIEENAFSQITNIAAKQKGELEMPEWFDPVFKESVAFGGRIFSDAHRYFQCDERHRELLNSISEKIKNKYLQSND
jgi:hypothetical protein